jgi:hypothetical protein
MHAYVCACLSLSAGVLGGSGTQGPADSVSVDARRQWRVRVCIRRTSVFFELVLTEGIYLRLERTHTPVWVQAVGPADADPMRMFARLPAVLHDEERATYEAALAAGHSPTAYVSEPA